MATISTKCTEGRSSFGIGEKKTKMAVMIREHQKAAGAAEAAEAAR